VIYDAANSGGDLHINNGGILQLNGGSWTQTDGISWLQLAGGTLLVNGGTFNQGTAGNVVTDASTVINVVSGAANFNGDFVTSPTGAAFIVDGGSLNISGKLNYNGGNLAINGGTLTLGTEFDPIVDYTLTSGTLITGLISFANGSGNFNLAGGSLVLGSGYNGVYGGEAAGRLNIELGSSNISLTVSSDTALAALFSEGQIGLNGAVATLQDLLDNGFVLNDDGNVLTYTAAIPEPSMVALLLVGGLTLAGTAYRKRSALKK
jgi:hypothetical protein